MAILGEIKLFPYDDVPEGYLECCGQTLEIKNYPKLYMMIGTKYGKADEKHFSLPNLTEITPYGMVYCIVVVGDIPKI